MVELYMIAIICQTTAKMRHEMRGDTGYNFSPKILFIT